MIKMLPSIRLVFACVALLLGSVAQAQRLAPKPHTHPEGEECGLIRNPAYERMMKRLSESELRAFPSRVEEADRLPVIHKNQHTYKIRLAVGISKSSFWGAPFYSDRTKIKGFLDDMQAYLNNIYERDCGVSFEIIRNDNLLLDADKYNSTFSYREGTAIFDEILGSRNYEAGIIVRPAKGHLAGQAILGGIANNTLKGHAESTTDYSTIAHELGHLLGAEHTHTKEDAIFVEPERGQSVMSYGYPRTFFALASIRSIRSTMSVMSYYTDEARTNLVRGRSDGENAILQIPFVGEHPQLDRSKLKREYKVPYGTFFQFSIPTTNSNNKGFLYTAHPFDISKSYAEFANLLQPSYPGGETPLCMFHPRYEPHRSGVGEAQLFPHSNHFNAGIYTYVLSASNRGHHDTFTTKLNIVYGVPDFKIKNVTGIGRSFDDAVAGTDMIVTWEPCIQLYGKNSKVRILLSDDFGQTFKHVLAENIPNNGTWSGAWPYLTINRKGYPNYVLGYGTIGDVRAGVIKVEVVGEAAYALSKWQPYTVQGKEKINTGGFTLKIDQNKSLIFKSASNQEPPTRYLEVNSNDEVPQKDNLKASLGRNTQSVPCVETRDGNIITRKWSATISGKKSTYIQLIKIMNEGSSVPEYTTELSGIEERVKDLYKHIGELGYPKEHLAESQKFKKAYDAVYDGAGEVKADTNNEKVTALSAALKSIGNIADEDIVMPSSGSKYKIASYHKSFKGEKNYYLQPNGGQDEKTTTSKSDGASWSLQVLDGIYRFTSGGQGLHLHNTVKEGNGVRLVRGFTWGAFGIISQDKSRIAQINTAGNFISFNEVYINDSIGTRINQPGITVSTDFKLELVDESFDVFFDAKTWTSVSAKLVGTNKPTLSTALVSGKRYKVTIPQGQGFAKIIFEGNDKKTTSEIQLIGRSAVYSESGVRSHSVEIGTGRYSTLYLDYPVTLPEGVKAFTATATSTGSNNNSTKEYHLKLKALTAVIPARTAVILYSETPQTYDFVETTERGATVSDNVLVGSMEAIPASVRDNNYHYFDLSKPSGNTASNDQTLSYSLADNATIAANTAYYRLYKYSRTNGGGHDDSNYNVRTTKLNTDEFKATATPPVTPPPTPPSKPEPEPTPAPKPDPTPEPPAPPTPPVVPTPPPTDPEPPTPTPPVDPAPTPTPPPPTKPDPVPPTNPNDGGGNSDVDDSGDDDNTPDDNGSVDGQPNKPIGEDGTIDRPYSARSIARLELEDKAVWLRGRVLGWLSPSGSLQTSPTDVVALGEDNTTYIPVFIPRVYRTQVESLTTQPLLVEGVLSSYLKRRGISERGFKSLRAEGIVFTPDHTDEVGKDLESPYLYTGYIYDLSGRIVGKGNFSTLPKGIYILGGKKYIKR